MMRILALLFGLIVAAPAHADVTIYNYVGSTLTYQYQASKYDLNNNQIDAHDGFYFQIGAVYYKIGTAYACGFIWQNTATSFCGFNVYSSTDMGATTSPSSRTDWQYVGQLFDPNAGSWQNWCGNGVGCGGIRGVYNAANNNIVMWMSVFPLVTPVTPTPDNAIVLTCAVPASATSQWSCTPSVPSGVAHPRVNDPALDVDGSGNGYLYYGGGDFHIHVEPLNSTYTDSLGTPSVDIAGPNYEGVGVFHTDSSHFFVTYGGLCAYCLSGAPVYYSSASTPLGAWSAPSSALNANSCETQPHSIAVLNAGGVTSYLWRGDQWNGRNNEAVANEYIVPLSVSGFTISPFVCGQTTTIQGITGNAPPNTQSNPVPDVTSIPGLFLAEWAELGAGWEFVQTFIPTKSFLKSISLALSQYALGADTVSVALTTVDGSNHPVTTLKTVTLTAGQLSWAEQFLSIPFNYPVTPGQTYGIVLSTTSASKATSFGSYTAGDVSPYPTGVQSYSTDNGASWTTLPNRAFMFSTFPNSGGHHVRIP